MDANDIAIATGGITSPLWLPALNDWLALVLVSLSIIIVIIRLIKVGK